MPDDSIVSSNETNDSHLKAFDCCDDSESQLGPAKKHTQKKKKVRLELVFLRHIECLMMRRQFPSPLRFFFFDNSIVSARIKSGDG